MIKSTYSVTSLLVFVSVFFLFFVQMVLAQSLTAEKSRDYHFYETKSAHLSALIKEKKSTYVWRIVSGLGGQISDTTNPSAIFTADRPTSYRLRWVCKGAKGKETYEELTLRFYGASCRDIKARSLDLPDGAYAVNPGLDKSKPAFDCVCDMTTDGGGWTLVFATTSAKYEQRLTSDTLKLKGNPLSYKEYNLTREQKLRIANVSVSSLLKRKDGGWLKLDRPVFDETLLLSDTLRVWQNIGCTESGGEQATVWLGFTTRKLSCGDFAIADASYGFDYHAKNQYGLLNINCFKQYLYSFGSGYNSNFELGLWKKNVACNAGTLAFFVGMR